VRKAEILRRGLEMGGKKLGDGLFMEAKVFRAG